MQCIRDDHVDERVHGMIGRDAHSVCGVDRNGVEQHHYRALGELHAKRVARVRCQWQIDVGIVEAVAIECV